ncbi:MAG TPA: VIT and VWA domain-containing protein [Pyrinomonadaceae bacterium]|nr:VIT and VWA domain-containing protein [Pyrinomonadaceae bacterium]
MKLRTLVVALATFFCGIVLTLPATAQGVIVPIICDFRPCRPRPIPQPLPNALPVKSIQIDTKIVGQVATTRVEQVFRNDTPHTLEGTYFFPIPETASIVEFAIWENGKRLAGEVRSREEARRIYDEIVRRQKDPGLLEYAGKDLFQASIFPIPGNSDKKLELVYSQVLQAESGTVSYRYPLGTGRNLWNRQQGFPEAVRVAGPGQKFGTISGKVEIIGKEALRNVYSPSHKIDVANKGERNATVTFETTTSDSDFQLFYGLSNDDFGMTLLTHREPGKDGYFLLLLSPKDDVADRELVSKDIVFVLDTSGSMADEGKMDKARAALLFGIRSLRDGDRFNVISFAGEERLMERDMIAADANGRRRGEEFVKKLTPTGGTNINDSLMASLKQFDISSRPKILVFMTDGLPTVGETNIDKINANVKTAKKVDVRIFPFGVGYDVNTALLDKLGSENGGISDYVQPKEDLEVKVSSFFTKVSSPVLSDLELDFGGADVELMYPRKAGDLFKGMQLVVLGRYKNGSDVRGTMITLRGKNGTESRRFTYADLNFPVREEENEFLPRLWASRRVGWLIEQIRINGETKELRDEIVELGTRYGIVTPYTSYLATDGSLVNAARSDVRQLTTLSRAAAPQMKVQSGADAVRQSVQQNAMQENSFLIDGVAAKDKQIIVRNSAQNQFVASKNFFNQSNVWVDADFKPELKQKEVNLKFGSDEYFAVLNRERALAQYFALGEEVVVVWNNQVYRVTK